MSVSFKTKQNNPGNDPLKTVGIFADTLFLIAEALYIAHMILNQTAIFLDYPDSFGDILLTILCATGGIRVIVWITRRIITAISGRKDGEPAPDGRPAMGGKLAAGGKSRVKPVLDAFLFFVLLGCTVALYVILYNKNSSFEILILLILTLGNIGISYKNVLKAYSIASFVTLSVALLYGMARVTIDYVRFEDGNIRGSMGICYPTDYASLILFAVIIGAAAFEKLSIWIVAAGAAASFFNAHFIADSNNSSICSILFLVLTFFMLLDKYVLGKKKGTAWISGIFKGVTTFSFVICAAVMILLTCLYPNDAEFLNKINTMLNGRLYLADQALTEHGVSLLGTVFDQQGGGFSFFANEQYNFVDSSYPLILIRYGILYLIFCAVVSTVLIYRAWKSGNRRMVTALTVISVHSIIEHHYIQCAYNVFILLLFAMPRTFGAEVGEELAESSKKMPDSEKTKISLKKDLGISLREIITVILVLIFVLFVPKLLNGINTIAISKGYFPGDWLKWKYIFATAAAVSALAFGIYGISGLVENIVKRSKQKTALYAIGLAAGVLAILAYLFVGRISLRAAGDVYSAEVSEDIGIVAHTADIADGKVYEDTMPLLYKKMGADLSDGYFRGEELGRFKNVSVFMDHDYDSKIFGVKGFKACEVSPLHVLYTNDESVINTLSEEGYEFHDRYPVVKYVDIVSEAERNDITYIPDVFMLLDGPEHSITHGPYVSLFSDNYRVTYELVIDKSQVPDDRYICMLSVRSLYGKNILADRPVFGADFDENGIFKASIDCYIDEAEGCEFLCFADNYIKLGIREISYMHLN